jgi:hypothetical protein
MKNLLLLFLAVVPSLMSGQSIELLPFACEAETLASVSVGPYQQMVAFSVSVPPGTQWELRSCADGVCHFERMVSSTLADTLVIEHSSTYPPFEMADAISARAQFPLSSRRNRNRERDHLLVRPNGYGGEGFSFAGER